MSGGQDESAAAMPPERPLDPGVLQRRASDPRAHAWVSASAGSGKTKVLTDRVLRLLLGDAETPATPPHRILAITFTKAAAAEMAGRIVDTLAAWATIEDARLDRALFALTGERPDQTLRERARRLFTLVLDEAGGLQIETIHGFCQSLLARFPLESGIAPGFRLMEETEAAALLAAARDDVLRAAEGGGRIAEAIAELAALTTVPTLVDVMAAYARHETRLRAALAHHGSIEAALAALALACGTVPGETVQSLHQAAMEDRALDSEALREAAAILSRGNENDQRKGEIIAAFVAATPAERSAAFDTYRPIFLTNKHQPQARLATKNAAAAIPAMQAEAERLAALRAAQQRVQLYRASAAAFRFAEAVLTRYNARKSQGALLDYDDLIRAAVRLLERETVPGWVMFKLDGGIDHVLVDEAQDTNEAQWRILSRLTAEFMAGEGARERTRTIFAVGDEKQSIFSFQGADPSVFADMQRHFAERAREAQQRFAPVDLNISFRSTNAVLAGVDCVFARAAARAGVTNAAEIRHIAQRRGMGGRIELWPLAPRGGHEDDSAWEAAEDTDSGPDADERLARIIAATIDDWLQRGETLPARGRPIRAGDILVLMRRRTGFANALVRGLKARGVPVAGIDRMVLKDQIAVQDLLALVAVLLLPEDDLTLACLLKSPLIGYGEEDLFALACKRTGLLWNALREAALGGDGRADAVVTYISGLRREADLLAPYALLQHVLDSPCPADVDGSGRRALLARLGEEALDPLKEVLNAALLYSDTQTPSLQGFLAFVERSGIEIKREAESGVSDVVRLMTVHAAKGLQAPIVFLADTVSVPQQSELLGWSETDPPLPLWAARSDEGGAVLADARARQNAVRDEEYRRLLYVAMTRAADRLIVCGWQPGGKRQSLPEGCWYELVREGLGGLAASTPFDFRGLHRDGWDGAGLVHDEPQTVAPEPDRAAAAAAAAEASTPALPDWAGRPAPAEPSPSRPLRPSDLLENEPGARSPLAADDRSARFQRGTLIHRLLEFLPDMPQAARAEAARRFLALPGHGLGEPQQAALWREVETVLNDPAFAAVFSPQSRAEVPIVGLIGSVSVSGQVDRLLVEPDRILLVDYKTNRPPPRVEAEIDPAYRRQMAAYRAVLAAIYPEKRIDCALLWTDGPRLMPLSAALLDAEGLGA